MLAVKLSTVVMMVAFCIFQFCPNVIVRIFGTESELYQEFAVKCLRIYLLFIFLNGFQGCVTVLFQSIGKPIHATAVSMSRQILFFLPAMLILSAVMGIEGILWAGAVADALAFVLGLYFVKRELKHM